MKQRNGIMVACSIILLLAACTPNPITGRVTQEPQSTFDFISKPVIIAGLPAIPVEKDGGAYILHGGSEWGKSLNLDFISELIDFNGVPAFVGHNNQPPKSMVIVGDDIIHQSTFINNLTKVNDQLAFVDITDRNQRLSKSKVIVGKIIDGTFTFQEFSNFEYAQNLVETGGKLAFDAYVFFNPLEKGRWSPRKYFVVYDGEEVGKSFRNARFASSINERLAFVGFLGAGAPDGCYGSFVYYDGERFGEQFKCILAGQHFIGGRGAYHRPIGVGGVLTYVVQIGQNYRIVQETSTGTKIIGEQYENAYYPIDVSGNLAYVATDQGKTFIVFEGQEFGKQFARIRAPFSVNGKLGFKAIQGGAEKIIIEHSP